MIFKLKNKLQSKNRQSASTKAAQHPSVDGHKGAGDPQHPLNQLQAASAQSVGKLREHNEDAVFGLTTLPGAGLPFGLYIVADGMGGHQHGEVASALAVRTISMHVSQNLLMPMLAGDGFNPAEPLLDMLQAGVLAAHQAIIEAAPGAGTTVTAALVLGQQVLVAHVGDSRAYHFDQDGELKLLTRDHSLVQRLVELGQITPDEAGEHPQRNVLYRALGQDEPLKVDLEAHHLSGGCLLLCSDGLWGVAPDEEMGRIMAAGQDLAQTAEALVAAANQGGGPDNISAILVALPGEPHDLQNHPAHPKH